MTKHLPRYLIRKSGRTWKLYERHGANGVWHGPVMESSYWENVAWLATKDPTYRIPGFILWPALCRANHGTRIF
jgi:hypothetical protein